MPYLELRDELRELPPGETIVGSGAQSSWRIQKLDLAAKHFAVRVGPDGGVVVRATSTQNVVLVNGHQIGLQGTDLKDGDIITAGMASFYFVRDAAAPHAHDAEARGAEPHLLDERSRVAYPLSRKSVTIGRDSLSSIFVRDPHVSRFHADIRAEAGAYVLYAMGSAGTQLNGRRVSFPRALEEGDRLEIGDTSFVFTRQPLPPGTRVNDGSDEADRTFADRATGVHPLQIDEDTGEGPRYRRRRSPLIPILLVLLLGFIAMAVLFALW